MPNISPFDIIQKGMGQSNHNANHIDIAEEGNKKQWMKANTKECNQDMQSFKHLRPLQNKVIVAACSTK